MTIGDLLVRQKAELCQLVHHLNNYHAHDEAAVLQAAVVATDAAIDAIAQLGVDDAPFGWPLGNPTDGTPR